MSDQPTPEQVLTKKCPSCFQGWCGFNVCRVCNGSAKVDRTLSHYARAIAGIDQRATAKLISGLKKSQR